MTVTDGANIYASGAPNAQMNTGMVTNAATGGNLPHTNIQPVLCVNFIIALQGVFPSRS